MVCQDGAPMNEQGIKTLRIQIIGKVQGVFFRDYTRRKAEELQLAGWVKNRPDGSVEALVSGEGGQVKKMVEWFHLGSPHSNVQKVITHDTDALPDTHTFQIKW